MKNFKSTVAASALLSASLALAGPTPYIRKRNVATVEVKGNAFFAGDKRFYIRGLDYQPGGAASADTDSGTQDPLAHPEICSRDIEKFEELGINTIRVYSIDNSKNHDDCMNMLADAGIYLALDVNNPKYSINRDSEEKADESYNDAYLQSIFATVEMMAQYDNTLLFFSGNEVINTPENSNTAPFIKAVTRDIKSYLKARGHRHIPVGYSAADVEENRYETATYMNCGTEDERSDFFAFNDYSWCDPSDIKRSGWADKVKQYADYSIPLFLSEFGCIEADRKFQEVAALYSDEMTSVYSGGLVYEYTEEGTGYGIVKLNGNKVQTLEGFDDLKKALAGTPEPSNDGGYKENGEPSQCPPESDTWDVKNDRLPAIPLPAGELLKSGAGDGPGLDGPGSMFPGAGETSPGTAQPGSGEVDGDYAEGSDGDEDAGVMLQSPAISFVLGLAVLLSIAF